MYKCVKINQRVRVNCVKVYNIGSMNKDYFTFIDGKWMPNWVLAGKTNDTYVIAQRCIWNYLCDMTKELAKNPKEWEDKVRNPEKYKKYNWERTVNVFDECLSDDFIYSKMSKKYDLDDYANGIFSDLTYRQIIDALDYLASDKYKGTTPTEAMRVAYR